MKSAMLALIWMLLATTAASAQKIRFTDTTNKWMLAHVAYGCPGDIVAFAESAHYYSDTMIGGHNYRRMLCGGSRLAIREDTVLGKLYFRFVNPFFQFSNRTDSQEHVLFDYNLEVTPIRTIYPYRLNWSAFSVARG